MANAKNDDGLLKGGRLPAHGPRGEGRDPLTLGKTTYGEDIKGNSTVVQAEVEEKPDAPEAPSEPQVEETVPVEAPVTPEVESPAEDAGEPVEEAPAPEASEAPAEEQVETPAEEQAESAPVEPAASEAPVDEPQVA